MFCPKCGEFNNDDSKFCYKCGEPFGRDVGVQPVQIPVAMPAASSEPPASGADMGKKPPSDKKLTVLMVVLIVVASALLLTLAGLVVYINYDEWFGGDGGGSPTVEREVGDERDDTDTDAPDERETDADTDAVEPEAGVFGEYRAYVCTSASFSDYFYPCVRFYSDGTFTLTENLLSGMGKYYGTYTLYPEYISLKVYSCDFADTGYAGENVRYIEFIKGSGDSWEIGTDLCGTSAGMLFSRDDIYVPSDSFVENQMDYTWSVPDEVFADGTIEYPYYTSEYEYHATVSADGGLNMRKGAGTDKQFILLIPDGSTVIEWGSNEDSTWYFVEYDGRFGWVSGDYLLFDGGMAKPVIYLYPETETYVDVSLTIPGGALTCTYPAYNNGWSVLARPDGTLINRADGLEYSYLYWEGEGDTKYDFSRGFCVAGEDTAEFLRETLTQIGLTPREYNEFIVYWLPLMQGNEYNLIAFQDEAYTDAAVLDVTPAPDSLLRVFMAYTPLDEPVELPAQHFDTFERSGFTVVEWGGCEAD